jgi:pseudouridine synthase
MSELKDDDYKPIGAESAVAVIELTVCEGKYRMVRRMLHNAGASVLALHRMRYGSISLGSLEVGSYRDVSDVELTGLG